MNRYTQLSTSSFNPLSFEELAVNPAMKRKQHDEMQANAINLKSQLNAYTDTLPGLPREYAQKLSAEMNNLTDSFAGRLNEQGVTNGATADMIALNRKYQDLLSPQGELGLLNAQKKDYMKKYEDYLKSAKDQKHSEQDAALYWQRMQEGFTGFDKDGKIINVNGLHAPEKLDLIDFMKDRKPLIGQVKSRLDGIGGGSFGLSGDGKHVVVRNKSGEVHRVTNIPGLEWIQADYQNTFLNPNGKGYKSNEFRGISPLESTRSFVSMLNSMVVNEVTDTRNESISLTKNPDYMNPLERLNYQKALREEQEYYDSKPGVITSTGNTIATSEKYKSGSEMLNTYYDLKDKVKNGKATAAQAAEYNELHTLITDKNSFYQSPEYKQGTKEMRETDSQAKKVMKERTGYSPDEIEVKNGKYYRKSTNKALTSEESNKYKTWYDRYYKSVIKTANEKVAKLNDKGWESAVITTPEFTLTKGNDAAMNTLVDNTNQAVINHALNNLSAGAITNVKLLAGNKNADLSLEDKKELSSLLKTLTPKQVDEYVRFTQNKDGSLTYTLKIPKGDGDVLSKFKSQGVWSGGYKGEDLSGGFELSFKTSKNSNTMGIPTAVGHQLNALGSSDAGYNDQRFSVETRGANFNYRYNAVTGQPLSYGDALGMITGQIPSSHFSSITGTGDTASINAVIERARVKAQAEIMTHLAETGRPDYFESVSEQKREELLLMYMQNNASTPIY